MVALPAGVGGGWGASVEVGDDADGWEGGIGLHALAFEVVLVVEKTLVEVAAEGVVVFEGHEREELWFGGG